jgi:hypothetical protein
LVVRVKLSTVSRLSRECQAFQLVGALSVGAVAGRKGAEQRDWGYRNVNIHLARVVVVGQVKVDTDRCCDASFVLIQDGWNALSIAMGYLGAGNSHLD